MRGAQTAKMLGSLVILGFAWNVGGLEAWVCAGVILMAVWAEEGPKGRAPTHGKPIAM